MILLRAKPRHFIPHASRQRFPQQTARRLCCQPYDAKETWRPRSFATATRTLGDTQARHEISVGTLARAEGASWTGVGGSVLARHGCLMRSVSHRGWFAGLSGWRRRVGLASAARCVISVESSPRLRYPYDCCSDVYRPLSIIDNIDYQSGYRSLPISFIDKIIF